jgi:hypothetical protein
LIAKTALAFKSIFLLGGLNDHATHLTGALLDFAVADGLAVLSNFY